MYGAEGGELSVEEMYKRTLQEVGSLKEQLGESYLPLIPWNISNSMEHLSLHGTSLSLIHFCSLHPVKLSVRSMPVSLVPVRR